MLIQPLLTKSDHEIDRPLTKLVGQCGGTMTDDLHVFLINDVLLDDDVVFQLEILDGFVLDIFQTVFLLFHCFHAVQLHTTWFTAVGMYRIRISLSAEPEFTGYWIVT